MFKVPCVVSSVCCWCHLKMHEAKRNRTNTKNNVTFKLMFWSVFLQGTTHTRYQASSSTHLRLACRLQLRPPNLVILIHRCVQLGLQILVLRGCFEHTFAAAIILCMRTIENGYWSTNTCCGCAQHSNFSWDHHTCVSVTFGLALLWLF